MFSELISFLGLGQRAAANGSGKRIEATKLNTEFEHSLHSTAQWIRSEQVHLRHRIASLPIECHPLQGQTDEVIVKLLDEVEMGLQTAENSRRTIMSASSFASLSQWDEVISILHQQKSAAELQRSRAELAIGQFHRILDGTFTPDAAMLANEEENCR